MRKFWALVLTALLICTAASAETIAISSTSLTLETPDSYESYELGEEDINEDCVAHYSFTDGAMEMYVYVFPNDGWTIQEIADALKEEVGENNAGLTDINGITCSWLYDTDNEYPRVEYETIDGDNIVMMVFTAGGDTQNAQTLMNTLAQ